MRMLFAILGFIAAVILLPWIWMCVLGLAVAIPVIIIGVVVLGGIGMALVWLLVSLDPRERAIAARQKRLDEELAARNAARAAQEGGPQPSK